MTEDEVQRAHDAACNLDTSYPNGAWTTTQVHNGTATAEPNAPAPDAMMAEMVNLVVAKGGGSVSRAKATAMVEAILEKQMVYYASMAEPEVVDDDAMRVAAVQEAAAMIEALIRQGGGVADYMADKTLWQRTAARARETAQRLRDLIV